MNFLKYTVWMVFAVCFVACSSSSDEEPEASEKPENKQIPINLSIGCVCMPRRTLRHALWILILR